MPQSFKEKGGTCSIGIVELKSVMSKDMENVMLLSAFYGEPIFWPLTHNCKVRFHVSCVSLEAASPYLFPVIV